MQIVQDAAHSFNAIMDNLYFKLHPYALTYHSSAYLYAD